MQHLTGLNIQRVLVNGMVRSLVCRVTELLQNQIDGISNTAGHRLAKLHPAVHYNAAIPEVLEGS